MVIAAKALTDNGRPAVGRVVGFSDTSPLPSESKKAFRKTAICPFPVEGFSRESSMVLIAAKVAKCLNRTTNTRPPKSQNHPKSYYAFLNGGHHKPKFDNYIR
jgi:hypothetical protein